jgi:glycosyltransferase involved in cell wall biosynthesis
MAALARDDRLGAGFSLPLSVLILTLDEEANLAGCLESLAWCDDIVVLDSYSSDRTVQIATDAGVRVEQRAFDNYAAQRNFGLQQIEYRHPWVLMIDADERVSDELREELMRVIPAAPADVSLYLLRRRDRLFGHWLKRSSGYPTWFGRVARLGQVWAERPVNEQLCTAGQTRRLDEHLEHFPFNKGLSAWIVKHDRYSTMEAVLMLQRQGSDGVRLGPGALLSSDPVMRRKAVKRLFYTLPARPLLMFFSLYVFKLGFLDGHAGFTFSLLRAWYEFILNCKYQEQKRRQAGEPV